MNEQKDHLDIFESYPLDRSDQTRSLNQRTEPVVWRCAYLLLTFALGLLFIVLVDAGDVVSGAVKLIFAALLILTLKRWTGAMILALVQAVLFHLEQPFFAPLS